MAKRALVTGGSRGIGRAVSLMLGKNGYDVVINYRGNADAAKATQDEVKALGVGCSLLQFDVSDFENAKAAIEKEIADNGKFDVLVFNAGVRDDALFPVMKPQQWDKVIDTNLKSFYYIVNPVASAMFSAKSGKIVVVSSTAGLTGMQGQTNYSGSKAGLIGAAKSAAVELARRNINLNIIAPGFVESDMTKDIPYDEVKKTIPLRRIAKPEDIANVVEFLISEKSNYIVGEVIAVNGGVLT